MRRIGLGFLVLVCLLARVVAASPAPSKEWSILWVIDNSSSFLAQREAIKRYLPTFSQKLKAAGVKSFKMAVTNTDYFSQQGNLISFGGTQVISGDTPEGIDQFKTMIDLVTDSSTSFWEQGLESAYQAIEKDGHSFLRSDVPLAIIYVTDENDYSCETNCFGSEPENNQGWTAFSLERYVAQFKSMKNTENIQVHPFPIVGLPSGSCQVASYGERYMGLMNLMGTGHAYSVCPVDLLKSLDLVASQLGTGTGPVSAPKWTANPIELKAMVGNPIRHALTVYVENGPKSPGYSMISGPAWVTVTADGLLLGTPGQSNIGDNVVNVSVCNQIYVCAETQVRIVVDKVNQPPVWKSFNIQLPPAEVGKAFSVDLSGFVTDPEGNPLTFKALRIPPWLSVSASGVLSGTPGKGHAGTFNADVLANDGDLSGFASLSGLVLEK